MYEVGHKSLTESVVI